MKVGDHVRVTTKMSYPSDEGSYSSRPFGKHPHAGKTGIITELLGVRLTGPDWPPRAMVKIDAGQPEAGNFMVVSLKFLEPV
jgi:hypothetical protein